MVRPAANCEKASDPVMTSTGRICSAIKGLVRNRPGFQLRAVIWLCAALVAGMDRPALAVGPVSPMVLPAGAVVLSPGMDLQQEVVSRPPGTTFFLVSGLYRTQQILPKAGDRFIGAPGAVLNGARLLKGAQRSGSLFVFEDQEPVLDSWRHGECRTGYPRCDRPQALFFDDLLLHAVARLTDVAAGTWFFDYDQNRIYVARNPDGHKIEITYRPYAFGGSASNVSIENLVVEKYASANQRGAINNQGEGRGWVISHNEVRWNYGYGITLATGHRAIDNYVHDNGQLGIGGGNSTDILVEGNEIASNVWNGIDCSWECGGAKWGRVSGLVVRSNYVHNNGGVGLWTDEGCRGVLFEENRIEGNERAGISHEISFNAVIRNNELRGNGAVGFTWGWRAQIQVQNSSDTEVYGNRVELDPLHGGNGIALIQQNRGQGRDVGNVFVHDNEMIMRGGTGSIAGWFVDFDAGKFAEGNNRFESNRYSVFGVANGKKAWFANRAVSFADWQAGGADRAGVAATDFP